MHASRIQVLFSFQKVGAGFSILTDKLSEWTGASENKALSSPVSA